MPGKYTAFRNRLRALEARLTPRRMVVRIEGGLPDPLPKQQLQPPGSDLARQHKMFVQRPSEAIGTPGGASERQKRTGGLP